MLKWLVIALAVIGLAIGVWTVATGDRSNPEPPPASLPSVNPFPRGVAATGVVEPASRQVDIAAPEPAKVMAVAVEVGAHVEQGQSLLKLDTRPLEAELKQAKASLAVAKAELAKAKAAPRPISVPPIKAGLSQARAELDLALTQYRQTKQAYDQDAATQQELDRAQSRLNAAKAAVAQAQARLAEVQAGTWDADLTIARQQVEQAQARVQALQTRIDRLTVTSPIAGTVLKRRVQPGEYASPGTGAAPLTLGRLETLHVRAKVDEEDAPDLKQGAAGLARIRGSADIEVPLEMLRIEPLAEPKQQLTGAATELVDTRVIEVVFKVTGNEEAPLYPGMLVDVFIKSGEGENG